MLILLVLLIALLIFWMIRHRQKKNDPEGFAAKSEARRARREAQRAKIAARREELNRQIHLVYEGGHPELTKSGPCVIIRSADSQSVAFYIRKASITIPTQSIVGVQLIPRSEVATKQKSGVSGAIVGDLIAGPAGAIIGGMATRKNTSKTIHNDLVVVTVQNGASQYQILFSDVRKQVSSKWYPKAASVLAPATNTVHV